MSERRQPSGPGRRLTFLLIGLSLPVLILVLVEFSLRAAGAAPRQPLFIQAPKYPEFSLANPRVIERFFSHPDAAPNVSVETGYFKTERNPGAFRIVTMGGSSAAGFPYGYGASLAGMLEQRLRRTFPEREIEVITTAMSAINSYSLLDFVDEIIALGPDAVLIYAGHNEFVGVLGVGSAFTSSRSPALTRLILRLREFALYRSLESLLAPEPPPADDAADDGTLMARVAAERRIASGSPLFERGREQFRSNLDTLLARYAAAGIPVFIGTLASNERDQPPFVSARDEDPAWLSSIERGQALLAQARAGETEALARSLVAQDPGDAAAQFLLGRALLAAARPGDALGAFRRARDEDQLRFRAPSQFNDVIRALAEEREATLVDVEAALRRQSRYGLIGDDLMTEHLHPNVPGYFLLADAFHDALLTAGLPGPAQRAVPAERAALEIPVSAVDRLFGDYKVLRLKAHWPFRATPVEIALPPPAGIEEELAQALYRQEQNWVQVHRRLKDFYARTGRDDEYLRVSLILADAFPYVGAAQLDAGRALLAAERPVQAVRYLHAAARYEPGRVDPLLGLARAYIASGLGKPALETLDRAERLAPGNPAIVRLRRDAEALSVSGTR
jgi:tetratricopeptide (TPR) repeat protein